MGKQKTVQELEREVETARRNFDAAARNLEKGQAGAPARSRRRLGSGAGSHLGE